MKYIHRWTHFYIYGIFILSGISALTLQVIWFRLFSVILGSTIYASSLVLAAFMAGFALGAYLLGVAADRSKHLLLMYVLIEFGIGLTGLLLTYMLPRTGPAITLMYQVTGQSEVVFSALRFLSCFVLLLLPTTLMGATLPVMGRYLVRTHASLGRIVGNLYTFNTLGAATGAFLADYFFVRTLGVWETAVTAASINVFCALAAGFLRFTLKERSVHPVEKEDKSRPAISYAITKPIYRTVLVAFAASGFCTMALEVLWIRYLFYWNGSNRILFSVLLSILLLGIALGSALFSRRADAYKDPIGVLAAIEFGIGISIIALLVLFHTTGLPDVELNLSQWVISLFGIGDYFKKGMILDIFFTASIVFVPSFLLGAAFPVISKVYVQSLKSLGRDVGKLYFWNTLSGVAGAILGSYLFIQHIGLSLSLTILCYVFMVFGLLLWSVRPSASLSSSFMVLPLFLLPLGLQSVTGFSIYAHTGTELKIGKPALSQKIFFKEGLNETLTILELGYWDWASAQRHPAARVLMANSFGMASTTIQDRRYMRLFAHLPLSMLENPEHTLVIAFGTGSTAYSISRYPQVKSIDVVDLSKDIVDAAPFFEKWNHNVLQDRRVNVIVDDGRNFLLKTGRRYDLITGEPPPLANMGVVNLYTKEFFLLVRSHLNPGGLVTYWLPYYQLDHEAQKAVVKAFMEVFPDVIVWQGTPQNIILMGSNQPIRINFERVQKRIEEESVKADLRDILIKDPYALVGLILTDKATLDRRLADASPLTDNRPIIEFQNSSEWHGYHKPGWEDFFLSSSNYFLPKERLQEILDLSNLHPEDRPGVTRRILDTCERNRINFTIPFGEWSPLDTRHRNFWFDNFEKNNGDMYSFYEKSKLLESLDVELPEDSPQRELARALIAYYNKKYPEACPLFEKLLRKGDDQQILQGFLEDCKNQLVRDNQTGSASRSVPPSPKK